MVKIFAILMIIGMMNSITFSQTRIRFAHGKSSATVTGTLSRGDSRSYFVGARRGQNLTISIRGAGDFWLDIGGNEVGTGKTIELRSTNDNLFQPNMFCKLPAKL